MNQSQLVAVGGALVATGSAIASFTGFLPHAWWVVLLIGVGSAAAAAGQSILKAEGK